MTSYIFSYCTRCVVRNNVVETRGKSSGGGMNVSVAGLRSWKLLAGVLHTSGSYLIVAEYTFFWVGKTDGRWDAGVAIAVSNHIIRKIISFPTCHSERIMSLRVALDSD